jgi:hypothetical protein
VRWILNEVSSEIGNTFCDFVTEVEGTETRSTFGVAVSIDVVISLHEDVENKYSGTLLC